MTDAPFPSDSGDDGSGPEDPMLEQRDDKLEQRMDRMEGALPRIELIVTELKEGTSHLATASDLVEIKGRLNSLPTTWQTIAILATLPIGIASLVFATTNFLAHSGKSDALSSQAPK